MNLDKKSLQTPQIYLLILMLCAFFVRICGLNQYALIDDEIWHLMVAKQESLLQVMRYNFHHEIHPPLSNFIWYFALKISDNTLWLRMFSIIPGILLIPSAYIFSELYFKKRFASYAAAFLFTFAAIPIAMSTIIRAYVMMMLALVWAAIFVQRYCQASSDKSQARKYLGYYFLCCVAAVEFNHGAAITIFALGLILFAQVWKSRNKQDFVIITLIHLVLMSLVIGYFIALVKIFDFHNVANVFSGRSFFFYLIYYSSFFLSFLMGEEIKDSVSSLVNIFAALAFVIMPIYLLKKHQWRLLCLTFVPLTVVICADYFRIYPYTGVQRHSMPLFFSALVFYPLFCDLCAEFALKIYKEILPRIGVNFAKYARIFLVAVLLIATASYVISRDSFRSVTQNCSEFSVTKSDLNRFLSNVGNTSDEEDVKVTVVRNIWYLRWQYPNHHEEIITRNLAKFATEDGLVVYFTSFPERESSVAYDLLEYKFFFADLFKYLESQGKMRKVRSITFFDMGLKVDYIMKNVHPQLISEYKPFMNYEDRLRNEVWREGYNFGWAVNTSNLVLRKFYFKDLKHACGREMVVLSFAPQFIRNEILQKNFIDFRKAEKEFLKI